MVKTDLFRVFWGSATLWVFCLSCTSQTQAQVVPDRTLPVNSAVTVDGSTTTITGGTRAGSNLFHSFEQFSVIANGTAFFDNALDIQNILSRVTGGSISNIDGLIQANGSANLFLLNPNGIVFGPNARLDIGGSFLASTASSLVFADRNFSATDPNNTALLSVNVPLGVQFGSTANAIANQSTVTENSETENRAIVGLQVNAGETLALLGGDLNLEGGHLNAPAGRIELGSVAPNSEVNLTVDDAGLTLGYESVQNFQDIQLSQEAVASTRSSGGGNIQIQARELSVRDGSRVSVSTEGSRPAGNLTVTATELVEVLGGNESGEIFSTLAATSRGTGNSGNITITTRELITRDGADISVTSFNNGSAGTLTINATEFVELSGTRTSSDGTTFSRSGLFAATEGTQNGGNLTITTPRLSISDGARISVSTRGPGENGVRGGRGGNLIVNAAESIEINGVREEGGRKFRSGLFALSGEETPNLEADQATGDGGELRITTGQLTIAGGGQVSTASSGSAQGGNISVNADSIEAIGGNQSGQIFSTLAATSRGTGNSGNITIETRELIARDGADLSVTAFGDGGSGELNINATDSIALIGAGTSPDGSNFSRSGLFAATEGTQNGGNLNLETGRLIVKDGARISVSTRGPGRDGVPGGRGGNLTIAASESIELSGRFISTDGRVFPSGLFALSGEQRPTIPATAATGDGGNLDVTTDRLTVRDGAQVSVNAQGSGAAGNLTIDARWIHLDNGSIAGGTASGTGGNVTLRISDSLQVRRNSEISTTAGGTGNGGNLTIDANLIAAIENSSITANANEGNGGNIQIAARRGIFQAPDSEITASSQLGIDGVVSLNTPDIETDRELVDLPQDVTDPAEQVAQVCQTDREDSSSFEFAGRGGLPPRPSETLSSEALVGFESLSQSAENIEPRNFVELYFASLPESDEIALAPPALGWFVNDRGELVLSSQPLNVISQGTSFSAVNCHVR